MVINEFLTVEFLATFAGLIAATILVVQFTKSIVKDRFGDSAVRVYTFIVAIMLSFIFTANKEPTIQDIVLTILNSMIITIAAMGGYELAVDPLAKKIKKKEE